MTMMRKGGPDTSARAPNGEVEIAAAASALRVKNSLRVIWCFITDDLSGIELPSHLIPQRFNWRQVSRALRRISRRRNPDQRQHANRKRRRLPRDNHPRKPRG